MNAQLSVDSLNTRCTSGCPGWWRATWGLRENWEKKKPWTALTEAVNQERVTFYKDETACPSFHNAWQVEFYDQLCRLRDLSVNAYALNLNQAWKSFLILKNIWEEVNNLKIQYIIIIIIIIINECYWYCHYCITLFIKLCNYPYCCSNYPLLL